MKKNFEDKLKNITEKDIIDNIDFFEAALKGRYTDKRLENIQQTINKLKSLLTEPLDDTQGEPDIINIFKNNLTFLK